MVALQRSSLLVVQRYPLAPSPRESAVSHREEGPVFSEEEEEEVPEEEGGSSIGEEMMPMTTDDLDVDSAGGELYYTMHATRYSAARGEPERQQKQEEGWLQGAVSTLYDEH